MDIGHIFWRRLLTPSNCTNFICLVAILNLCKFGLLKNPKTCVLYQDMISTPQGAYGPNLVISSKNEHENLQDSGLMRNI